MLKWLEGVFGLGGGGLGLALTFFLPLVGSNTFDLSTAYATSVSYDSPGVLTPHVFAILSGLPVIVASVFFIGAFGGAWLDLVGQRRAGKQLSVACLIGLLVSIVTVSLIAFTIEYYLVICFMLILGATIIASLRREPSRGA